mmetsp:Transcript_45798/g.127479  ORF Transcript_45798/g.127479 Transcript_45798/m.127479 type:complete len:376 (-) Transcript_45798:728-1855(-)
MPLARTTDSGSVPEIQSIVSAWCTCTPHSASRSFRSRSKSEAIGLLMAWTWPAACKTIAVAWLWAKRAHNSAAASRAAPGGPSTCAMGAPSPPSPSTTRTSSPCCSCSGAIAASTSAVSGCIPSGASTVNSTRACASSITASTAARRARSASLSSSSRPSGALPPSPPSTMPALPHAPPAPSAGPPAPASSSCTAPGPTCAEQPTSSSVRRQASHCLRPSCPRPCGTNVAPRALARASSGCEPAISPRNARAASRRCFGAPCSRTVSGGPVLQLGCWEGTSMEQSVSSASRLTPRPPEAKSGLASAASTCTTQGAAVGRSCAAGRSSAAGRTGAADRAGAAGRFCIPGCNGTASCGRAIGPFQAGRGHGEIAAPF